MVYPKNVPNVERILRIALGIVLAAFALLANHSALVVGGLLFTAAFVVLTGFVGWCPACALVGRKLRKANSK